MDLNGRTADTVHAMNFMVHTRTGIPTNNAPMKVHYAFAWMPRNLLSRPLCNRVFPAKLCYNLQVVGRPCNHCNTVISSVVHRVYLSVQSAKSSNATEGANSPNIVRPPCSLQRGGICHGERCAECGGRFAKTL